MPLFEMTLRGSAATTFVRSIGCLLMLAALAVGQIFVPATGTAGPADAPSPARRDADVRSENTFAKDFIMDAPWRVKDANTPIPISIILKDCDVDDIRELHTITCTDMTSGNIIWEHDFNDEEIGDDASEHNYWTWITTVAENSTFLGNGTPLTPANLGYSAGQSIGLRVEVYYKDDFFNYTETVQLRVQVGNGPFPWAPNWFGGDTHYHTMYTNNIAEFGAPIPAVKQAAIAMGLHWVTTTDHSCDMDETGDGPTSYATQRWEYTLQNTAGTSVFVYDNVADGGTWNALGRDAAIHDSPTFRIYRGAEVHLASITSGQLDKTLHSLFYNPEYVSSPLCGTINERPVTPRVPQGLAQLSGGGFVYAAHPVGDLALEFGGVDFAVNGSIWGNDDLNQALTVEGFRGLEAFNTRSVFHSNDQYDPWPDFLSGVRESGGYPDELLAGITLWDRLLRQGVEAERKLFLSGGSDAHGDFNYSRYQGLDVYATDNAMGKAQTVVYVPGNYSATNLPPISEIVQAFRDGRSVITDGPFLEIGIDRGNDGSWYDEGDLMIGDAAKVDPAESLPMTIRWDSLPEFGAVSSVQLYAGNESATNVVWSTNPVAKGGFSGSAVVDLETLGLDGRYYLRAELLTSDGDVGHRAYTNPMWLNFDPSVAALAQGFEASAAGEAVHLQWELGRPIASQDLRLAASYRDLQWTVDIPHQIGQRFEVWDRALPSGWSGSVRYDLLWKSDSSAAWEPIDTVFAERGGDIRPRPIQMTAVPNPFNPRTTIRFTLTQGGPAELVLHDSRGRRLRTLASDVLPSGDHAYVWDGRDDEGKALASGSYVASLRTGGSSASIRVVLLR